MCSLDFKRIRLKIENRLKIEKAVKMALLQFREKHDEIRKWKRERKKENNSRHISEVDRTW